MSIIFSAHIAAMENQSQRQREDYTIGIVCAKDIELAAMLVMLDEEHAGLKNAAHDSNTYTLGSIGKHNVVIACLPDSQTGTVSAAGVANQMKSAFPSIRFGLMVGIGGGVPTEKPDVRLGDVVVSRPGHDSGGVVQYDMGKTTTHGFIRTGSLNMPPYILQTAITKLKAEYLSQRRRPLEYPPELDDLEGFARRKTEPDLLFNATYNHVGGNTCRECSQKELVRRPPRDGNEIVVHYGKVASGNQVIKDATARDKISSELGGILCFEMEAAGLMNSFPCLVIRGISDYADSHKSDAWQPYAAGAAAAYAKELLSVIPLDDVARSRAIDKILRENNDLTPEDMGLLIRKARQQDESGRILAQKCSDKSRESKQTVSDASFAFLTFLYGLLRALWAPSSLWALLNQTLDQNLSQMDTLIISDRNVVKESTQEFSDIQDTLAQLDEAEKQFDNIQTLQPQRNSDSSSAENDDAELQRPALSHKPKQTSNEISKEVVDSEQQECPYTEFMETKEQLKRTSTLLNQNTTTLAEQTSDNERFFETGKDLRARSAGRGFWATVWMWISWLLNCESDNSES